MREDVESAYLDITEYTGQSLTGPRDLISRRVVCSNPQVTISEAQASAAAANNVMATVGAVSNVLQNLNFRILSTSPGAMLNSKVVLVLPMIFHKMVSHTGAALANIHWITTNAAAGGAAGELGLTAAGLASQYAPRRRYPEGLQKYQHHSEFDRFLPSHSKRRFRRNGTDFHTARLQWTDGCL